MAGKETELIKKIPAGKKVLLLTDFDGTLSPIAPTPDLAVLPSLAKNALIKLSAAKNTVAGVISGRSLREIKRTTGIKGLIYAGNHGLEIEGRGLKKIVPVPAATRSALIKIRRSLKGALLKYKGVIIEDKGVSLSVHYRLAGQRDILEVIKDVKLAAAPFLRKKQVRLAKGKKIVEIRPYLKWNKGHAVNWIRRALKAKGSGQDYFTVYMGDDITDEDAFKALRSAGLAVKIGSKAGSRASETLADTGKAGRFLALLAKRG